MFIQGGKLVWSDGSPADFSVWLEGSDPPPLSWACIAVFATAIFQVKNWKEKKKSVKLADTRSSVSIFNPRKDLSA